MHTTRVSFWNTNSSLLTEILSFNTGCSALAVASSGRLIVTGGIEGQVRVWKIDPYRQDLVGVLKDHSGPITSLDINYLDTEVISACTDGSCVIWDIK